MARSSPGVRRIASILNFIADHPGQSFVLTDLVRALKLSRATCHALLTGLVEVGYLYRASDKSYVLGPALAKIGKSVAEHFSPLQVAQPEMRTLADEFDLVCSAYFFEGEETAVVRERAASASHVGYAAPLGTRVKLRPQSAAIFFAWLPQDKADAWLDSRVPPPTAEQRKVLLKGMEFARQHGFILIVRTSNADQAAPEHDFGAENELPVALASEVQEEASYSVASILAPVFDAQGKVAFAIGLAGFHRTMQGSELLRLAERLKEACDRVTGFIVGRRPSGSIDDSLAA
jgi:DNA-binding IclR family transcriptional regulator